MISLCHETHKVIGNRKVGRRKEKKSRGRDNKTETKSGTKGVRAVSSCRLINALGLGGACREFRGPAAAEGKRANFTQAQLPGI